MKLSVIVPVYGTEKYIDTCLSSALKAVEGIDAEIIIVNDGTKDRAGELAQRYVAENPNVMVYFEKENSGLADTKNYGLKHARGEYVTFLDSDDYIEPEMYREMMGIVDDEGSDCVVCDMIYDYEGKDITSYQKCACGREEIVHRLIDTPLMASSCNKVVKKELMEGLSFPSGMNNEDIAVTPIVLGRSRKPTYIEKGFYHYVQRTGSIQRSSFSRKRFAILDVCKMTMERAEELPPELREMIKGAIYLHQVLAIPFYLIIKEPFIRRYFLLKEYMEKVREYFPDFYDNKEIHEYTTWDSNAFNTYKKVCLWLSKSRMYFTLSVLWTFVQPFIKN